jgi:hypothetical protein
MDFYEKYNLRCIFSSQPTRTVAADLRRWLTGEDLL